MDNPLLSRGKELPKILGVFLIYCLSLALFSYGVARVVYTLFTLESNRSPDYLRYTIQTSTSRSTGLDTSEDRSAGPEGAAIDLDVMALRNPFAIPVRLSAMPEAAAQISSLPSFARGEQQPAGAVQAGQLERFSRETALSGEVAPVQGHTAVPLPLWSGLAEASIGQTVSDSDAPARESLQADQLPTDSIAGFSSLGPADPFVGPRSYNDEAAQMMTPGAWDPSPVVETIARLMALRRPEPVGLIGGSRAATELVDTRLPSPSEGEDLAASRQAFGLAESQYGEAGDGGDGTLAGSGLRRPVLDLAMTMTDRAGSGLLDDAASGPLEGAPAAGDPVSATPPPVTQVPGGLGPAQAPSRVAEGAVVARGNAAVTGAAQAPSTVAEGAATASEPAVTSGAAVQTGEPRTSELAPIAVTRIAGIAEPIAASREGTLAAGKSVIAPAPDSADLSPSQGLADARGVAPSVESTPVSAEEGSVGPAEGIEAADEHQGERPHQSTGSVAVAKPKAPIVAGTPELELQESIRADELVKAEWPPIAITGVVVAGDGLSSATVRVSGKPQVIRQGDRLRLGDRADELEVVSIGRDLVALRLGDEVRQYRIGDGPDE